MIGLTHDLSKCFNRIKSSFMTKLMHDMGVDEMLTGALNRGYGTLQRYCR